MTDIVDRLSGLAYALRKDGKQMTGHEVKEAADEIERLRAERDLLREALQWMVDNDETNEGDEPLYEKGGRSWNEINAYWIDGLNRARAALKETGHD